LQRFGALAVIFTDGLKFPVFFEQAFDIIPVARKCFQNVEYTAFDDGQFGPLEALQGYRTIVLESPMEAFGDILLFFCNAGKTFVY
jgi:hypothetical protein